MSPRGRIAIVLLTGVLLAPAAKVRGQLLPDTGTTVQVGTLHQQLERLLAGDTAAAGTPGWVVTPSAGVSEAWTDHLREPGRAGNSSFISTLSPAVLVNGQTARVDTTLSYAPEWQHYSAGGGQDRINQVLDAAARVTLVPEHVFLDLRGFAAVQPVGGGAGPAGTVALAPQEQTQVVGFSAHPYLRERFGDVASAEAGVVLSHGAQTNAANGAFAAAAQQFTSEQEYASLASGPAFGRMSATLSASARQGSGTGVMNGAYRNEASLALGYAVTRSLTVLGSFGYQDIRYGGTPVFSYTGPDWSGGLRWVANADSSVTVAYGRHDGANAARLDAVYAPTARTRVYARYSDGVASGLEQLLAAVNTSGVDAAGNPVARDGGAPVQIADSFYGVPDYLARVTSASVTLVWLHARDAVSASASRQVRQVLATGAGGPEAGTQQTGYYGSLTWQREIWPNLQGSAFVQWGSTPQSGRNGTSVVVSLGAAYALSETLSATAQVSWTREDGQGVAMPPASLIVVGARKTF